MKQHTFVAVVDRLDTGMGYHFLPVPDRTADALMKADTKRRVVCRLNGVETRRALHGSGPGDWKLIVGIAMLRDVGAARGHPVEVVVWPDPNADEVEMCEEFVAALEQDDEARERFESMTVGRRRSLAYYVNSAKRSETRIRRAIDLTEKLRTRTLHGDR